MERRSSHTHLQAESPIAADKWGARTGSGWWAMRKAPPPQEQAFCLLLLAGKGKEAGILQPSVSRWRVELSWYHHVSLKVTYRGGPYLETSGYINLTGIISSDSCLSASGQLMTHSIAQTLILLKKPIFFSPVTFKTIQIWPNNKDLMKGLLEPVRLPGCNKSFDLVPFWYSVLVIARSIWVTILLVF